MQLMWPLLQDVVNSLYKCVMSRLMAQDQDQEVKDCAISCMAAAVSQLGDVITPQLPQVLQVTHTFWSCRPQPLMGLQPGHLHLLLKFCRHAATPLVCGASPLICCASQHMSSLQQAYHLHPATGIQLSSPGVLGSQACCSSP